MYYRTYSVATGTFLAFVTIFCAGLNNAFFQIFTRFPLWIHAPPLLESSACVPLPSNSTLLLCWRGLNITRAIRQMPALHFGDTLSICLQMHWAVMVPAEKLNIAHADPHCGNVVLFNAPNDGEFILRINFQLENNTALARSVTSNNSQVTGSVTLRTRFLLCLVDWARVSPANIWQDFPSALVSPRSGRRGSTSSRRSSSSGGRYRDENDARSFYNAGAIVAKMYAGLTSTGARLPPHTSFSLPQLLRWLQSGSGGSGWCSALRELSQQKIDSLDVELSSPLLDLLDHPVYGSNFSFRDFSFSEVVEWRSSCSSGAITCIGMRNRNCPANQILWSPLPVRAETAGSPNSVPAKKSDDSVVKVRPKRKERLHPELAPEGYSSGGRPRKWASDKDRTRAYRIRKDNANAAESLVQLNDIPPPPLIVAPDMFGSLYDTPYVSIQPSTFAPAGFKVLGVYATCAVTAGTVVTSMDDEVGMFPYPLRGVGSLIRYANNHNVRLDGRSVVSTRDIAVGEELLLPEQQSIKL